MSPATKRKTAAGRRKLREGESEPEWVSRAVIDALHEAQLREHGGSTGTRDGGLLESAMNRARTKRNYGERDLSALASAYAFGIAKNHAFVDGNKRSAFVTAALFLALNGWDLDAAEPETVDVMNSLASGKISENAFAQWLHSHMIPL